MSPTTSSSQAKKVYSHSPRLQALLLIKPDDAATTTTTASTLLDAVEPELEIISEEARSESLCSDCYSELELYLDDLGNREYRCGNCNSGIFFYESDDPKDSATLEST